MTKTYRHELVGVFGCPVDENPTVVLEEAAFRAVGLNYRYLNFEVMEQDLEQAMKSLTALGFKGINLTIPHKCAVLPFLDELSESAHIIGAVNTVVVKNRRLLGDNTDGKGFLLSLHNEGVKLKGSRVTILGAGGAARAIACELGIAGAKSIAVINRDEGRGWELSELVRFKTCADSEYIPWKGTVQIPEQTDILVNATSVGLFPHSGDCPDIDFDTVTSNMTVCDVIPNPPETVFLQRARQRGAKTINGLGMLVNQGAINFKLWTGVDAPVDVMTQAMQQEFGV